MATYEIGTGTMAGNYLRKSLVRTSDGDLYAILLNSGYVILKKSTDDGENWSDVSTNALSSNGLSRTEMTIDSNDVIHIAASHTSNQEIYYAKYTTSTSTLSSKTTLVTGAGYVPVLSVVVDSDDYVYVFYTKSNSNLACKKYTTSWGNLTDLTWGSNLHGGSAAVDSSDNIYAIMSDGSAVKYAKWNGSSWSSVSSLGSKNDPDVAIDSSDNMYVTYRDSDGSYNYIKYKKWSGSSWGSEVEVAKAPVSLASTVYYPSISIDKRGYIYVTYYWTRQSSDNECKFVYKVSTNGTSFGSESNIVAPPNASTTFLARQLNYGTSFGYKVPEMFSCVFARSNDGKMYIHNPSGIVWDITSPTVTTQDADTIATTSVRGNGNITATGGANATRRGFCYKVGTSGDPTTSDSVAYDDGSFSTGAYTKSITGLSPNTSYRVRAYAVNSAGTSYGSTVQVKTLTAFKPRTMWFN